MENKLLKIQYKPTPPGTRNVKYVENAYKKKMAPYKAKEKEDYKRFFAKDNENKQLMFYSESSGFYKYYRGMIEELLENSDIVIHYVTSDPEDQVFQIRHDKFQDQALS